MAFHFYLMTSNSNAHHTTTNSECYLRRESGYDILNLRTQFLTCFLTRIRPSTFPVSSFGINKASETFAPSTPSSSHPGKLATRRYLLFPPDGPPFKQSIRFLVLGLPGRARFSFRNVSERQFPYSKLKLKLPMLVYF